VLHVSLYVVVLSKSAGAILVYIYEVVLIIYFSMCIGVAEDLLE
jgi:hypothetical protein